MRTVTRVACAIATAVVMLVTVVSRADERDDEIQRLRAALAKEEAQFQQRESDLTRLNREYDDARERLDGLHAGRMDSERQMDELRSRVQEGEYSVGELESENDELRYELESMRARAAEAERDVVETIGDLPSPEAWRAGVEADVQRAEARVPELRDQIAELEHRLDNAREEMWRRQAESERRGHRNEVEAAGHRTAASHARVTLIDLDEQRAAFASLLGELLLEELAADDPDRVRRAIDLAGLGRIVAAVPRIEPHLDAGALDDRISAAAALLSLGQRGLASARLRQWANDASQPPAVRSKAFAILLESVAPDRLAELTDTARQAGPEATRALTSTMLRADDPAVFPFLLGLPDDPLRDDLLTSAFDGSLPAGLDHRALWEVTRARSVTVVRAAATALRGLDRDAAYLGDGSHRVDALCAGLSEDASRGIWRSLPGCRSQSVTWTRAASNREALDAALKPEGLAYRVIAGCMVVGSPAGLDREATRLQRGRHLDLAAAASDRSALRARVDFRLWDDDGEDAVTSQLAASGVNVVILPELRRAIVSSWPEIAEVRYSSAPLTCIVDDLLTRLDAGGTLRWEALVLGTDAELAHLGDASSRPVDAREPCIDVACDDVSLAAAVDAVATAAGLPTGLGAERAQLEGVRVSIRLDQVTVDSALSVLLRPHGFDHEVRDGAGIVVMRR